LPHEAGGEHGIEIVFGSLPADSRLVGKWIESLPGGGGHFVEFARIEIGNDDAAVGYAGAEMALIEGGLRGFQQEARRAGSEEGVLQLLLGGSVESDGAESLRTGPAVGSSRRDRLIEGAQSGGWRNFIEQRYGIFFAGAEFRQAQRSGPAKIGLREALHRLAEIGAGSCGISSAFSVAPEPVDRVDRIRGGRIFDKKCRESSVGIGLAIQVGDPGDSPLRIE